MFIREAEALSESAQQRLETLYRTGIQGHLAAHDARIFTYFYFKSAADEGAPAPRLILARIYADGAGVPRDLGKAKGLLKNNPLDDAKALLKDLTAGEQNHHGTGTMKPASAQRPNSTHAR